MFEDFRHYMSDSFPLSPEESASLQRIVQFIILIYAKHFLTCALATEAPRNDLNFIYNLRKYRTVDALVANAALSSTDRHHWYVVPQMVVLSLFDDVVPNHEKADIAAALLASPRPNVFPPGKPGQPSFSPQTRLLTRAKPSLSVFVTEESWLLFHLIEADEMEPNGPQNLLTHGIKYQLISTKRTSVDTLK